MEVFSTSVLDPMASMSTPGETFPQAAVALAVTTTLKAVSMVAGTTAKRTDTLDASRALVVTLILVASETSATAISTIQLLLPKKKPLACPPSIPLDMLHMPTKIPWQVSLEKIRSKDALLSFTMDRMMKVMVENPVQRRMAALVQELDAE